MPWLLVLKNLRAHPVRSLLTLGSVTVAIFLVCFLRTVLVTLEAGIQASAGNRLIVQSAVSLFVDLPLSYQPKIEGLDDVEVACKLQWFGGYYREQKNFFAQFGVDHDRLFGTYPEITLVEGSSAELARLRTGCVIGTKLAKRFGWKVGDRVPITGTIFRRVDGQPWEFEVVGIYASSAANVDEMSLWFRFDYLHESLEQGAALGPTGVGIFALKLAPGADPIAVSSRIEGMFSGGPQAVQCTTEAEFQRQFVSMLGSVPTFLSSIGGGVLFAILLAVLNTMMMSGRQQTRSVGVLKALGFSDRSTFALLICEALLLCGLGGLAGIGLALGTEPALGAALAAILPVYAITRETMALGLGGALLVGLIAGVVPAVQASRLRAVEALRAEV